MDLFLLLGGLLVLNIFLPVPAFFAPVSCMPTLRNKRANRKAGEETEKEAKEKKVWDTKTLGKCEVARRERNEPVFVS